MSDREADIARLLALAGQEITESVMPQLTGDARYRIRLVINALKLAGASIADAGELGRLRLAELRSVMPTEPTLDLDALEARLQKSLRAGDLDADDALYQALVIIAEARELLVK